MQVNQFNPLIAPPLRKSSLPASRPQSPLKALTGDRVKFSGFYGADTVALNGNTSHPELIALDQVRQKLEKKAKTEGLDFFPVRFHMLTKEKFLQAAARNGFLERYPHWSWGQEYFQLGFALQHGVNKQLELVPNGNPVPAMLLETQPRYAQKALMAMAIARSDLYKNNIHFRHSNRRLSEEVVDNARVIRGYINSQALGLDKVESYIDKVHSIRNLIDASGPPRMLAKSPQPATWDRPERDVLAFLVENAQGMEPWQKDILRRLRSESHQSVPMSKTKLMSDGWAAYWNQKLNKENAELMDYENLTSESKWSAETMGLNPVGLNTYKLGLIIFRQLEERFREEARDELKAEGIDLPSPISETSQWEALEGKLSRLSEFFEHSLKDGSETPESLEKLREGLARFPMSKKQQALLEERVQAKLKTVRKMETDVSLIRKYFTREMAEEAFLYTYQTDARSAPRKGSGPLASQAPGNKDTEAEGTKLVLDSREFEDIRSKLVEMFENAGQPVIEIVNPDFQGKGELLLRHIHDYDLKKNYAEKTLTNLAQLWGKPVHLLTKLTDENNNEKVVRVTSDGKTVKAVPATEEDRA